MTGTEQSKRGCSLPFYRPRQPHGSRIQWLLAPPSFHSPPGAQTNLVRLCFSPSQTLHPSCCGPVKIRSGLAGSDHTGMEKEEHCSSQSARPTRMAMVMTRQHRGEKLPGAHNAECNVDPVPTKQLLPGRQAGRLMV